jgi:hypothetical protein
MGTRRCSPSWLALLCAVLAAGCAETEVFDEDAGRDLSSPDRSRIDLGGWPDMPPLRDGQATLWKLYAHDRERLFVMDPSTLKSGKPRLDVVGTFSFDSSIPVTERSINDIAVTTDGLLYAVSKTYLYRVDPLTAKLTKVTEVRDKNNQKPPPNVALTFERSGRLLASDKEGALRRIHYTGTQTGLVEDIGSYGDGQGSSGDLVAIQDGTIFGVSDKGLGATTDNNRLLKVSSSTGKATPIGYIGHGYVWGLAYWSGIIYGFTSEPTTVSGKLLKIDPVTGKGTLLVEYPYYPYQFWGAAVTPLAPIQ